MYHCFFRRHVCLSNLKHAPPLTARKTVFSHLNKVLEKLRPQLYRPLPNSKNTQFQNEAKCTAFLVKMSFICMRMKNHFHAKGWALNLVLIKAPGETRKWLIRLRWKFVLIRVTMTWEFVIAKKWRHYLFYLQPYFLAQGTALSKSFTGTFSSNSRIDVREV